MLHRRSGCNAPVASLDGGMGKADQQPDKVKLTASLEACIANGVRLLEDADWVLHLKRTRPA